MNACPGPSGLAAGASGSCSRAAIAGAVAGQVDACEHDQQLRTLDAASDLALECERLDAAGLAPARLREPACGRVAQGADEEQEPAQPVVHSLLRPGVQGRDHVDICISHADQRSGLVLTVLEAAFLVRGQADTERGGDLPSERMGRLEREHHESRYHARNVPPRHAITTSQVRKREEVTQARFTRAIGSQALKTAIEQWIRIRKQQSSGTRTSCRCTACGNAGAPARVLAICSPRPPARPAGADPASTCVPSRLVR